MAIDITYRTILVIGENHEDIVKKYSESIENNPNAFYKYERCQQHRLEVTGEEGDFSDPFPLKNNTKSYSAHFNDINWEILHKSTDKIKLAKRAWELVVDEDSPNNEQEELLISRMKERKLYFLENFKSKEEYAIYYSSLWFYGVATEEKYEEVNTQDNTLVMEWCVNFFDNFIKPLQNTNELITIYEVRALD